MRTPSFHFLFWSFFVCGFQTAFVMLHLPAYVVDMGLSANIGMSAVAMIGLFNIFGSFLSGWLGGLYSKKWLLAWIYALRIVAILALMLFPLSPLTLYVFAAVMGLLWLGTVPLAVGHSTPEAVAEVLDLLWGGAETLIVASSDLSHFLPYATAQQVDGNTCRHILQLDTHIHPEQACGAYPINGLLLAAGRRGLKPTLLGLCNSGDTAGDRSRVVGYAAFAFAEGADHG